MNFKQQSLKSTQTKSHSSPLFSENNILNLADANTLNKYTFYKQINQQTSVSHILISVHFQEICIDMKIAGL